MSGSRMTVVLETVNGQKSGEEGYRLRGENYRQEKLFEVNLKSVRSYVVRRRTWHEVTAKDSRNFVLSFEDGETFAIFYERLVNALKSLGKFTTGENLELEERDPGDGKIFVLRVDRVAPRKPPRFRVQGSGDEEIPGFDVCDGAPQSVAMINNSGPSTDLGDKSPVNRSEGCVTGRDKRISTIWYTDICDINSRNDESGSSDLVKLAEEHIYDSIGDDVVNACNFDDGSDHGMNSTADPTTEASGSGRIPVESPYDNATSVFYSKPNRHKKKNPPACGNTDCHRILLENADQGNVAVYDNPFGINGPTERESSLIPEQRRVVSQATLPAATDSSDQVDCSMSTEPKVGAVRPTPKPRQRHACGPSVAASSPAEFWTCERCTLINPITAKQCAVCETRRNLPGEGAANNHLHRLPSSYVVSSDVFHRLTSTAAAAAAAGGGGGGGVDDGWQCSRCDARNFRESKLCRSCSAWVCGQCTLHNHPEHLACFTCASPKFRPF